MSRRIAELEAEVAELRALTRSLERELARTRAPAGPARASLVEREALLSAAERIAHVGSWVWNVGSNQVAWSDELFRILGYDPDVDSPSVEAYFARVHPDDRELARTTSERGVATGLVERVGYRLLLPSGEVRHVRLDGAMRFDRDGQLQRIVGVVVDVTAAHEARGLSLRADSLVVAAEMVNNLGFVQIDLATGERQWSAGTRRVFCIDDDVEPSAEAMLARIHPDDLELVLGLRERVLATRGPASLDFRVLHPSGEVRYVRGGGIVTDDEYGRFMTAVFIDISEQHALHQRLESAQRLEAIGRLAGGVAHDINNLMMVVATIAHSLAPSHPHEAARLNETVASASSLTQSLLSVSGKARVELETANLNAIVERILAAARPLVPAFIELSAELDPGLPALALDARRIEHALLNLVLNARDALAPLRRGTIRVETARDGDRVQLRVVDDGPGMGRDVRTRAMEPFFTTKPPGKGTGMGLALVRGAAELHGGSLAIDSAPGRGSRMTVELPLEGDGDDAPASVTRPVAERELAPRRCLIIDDNDGVRMAIAELLRTVGFAVFEARGAEPAFALAGELDPPVDLVICDLSMPDMLGPAVIAELRRREQCPDAVLYVTGYGDAAAEMLAPDDVVLTKPFTLEQMREAIAGVLERRAAS